VPGATHLFWNVNKSQTFSQFWSTLKRKKKVKEQAVDIQQNPRKFLA
jgi:hypothetical protein